MEAELRNAVGRLRVDRDISALERIYASFKRSIYVTCLRMSGNAADAEDLTHDTFVEAYRAIGSLRSEEAFPGWICRIAANLCIDHDRSEKRKRSAAGLASAARPDPAGETDGGPAGLAGRLQAALSELPADQRAAFVLGPIRRMPYSEIAEALSCSVDAVKMRVSRARRAVIGKLGPLPDREE